MTNSYDALGRRTSLAAKIGSTNDFTNTYEYDSNGRMTTVKQSGTGIQDKRVDFTYDDVGRTATITRYEDLAGLVTKEVATTTYTYDDNGRLTDLEHEQVLTLSDLGTYEWTWDDAGRITQFVSPDGTSDYTYDDTNQLTGATHTYQTDESYTYDANGNRTGGGYIVGPNNWMLSDGTYDYEYDDEGNRTKRTHKTTGDYVEYEWDHRNRLTGVKFYDALDILQKEVQYRYDVNNKRIEKEVDSDGNGTIDSTERYVRDEAGKRDGVTDIALDDVIFTFDGNNSLQARYLHGPGIDQPLAAEDSSDTLWVLADHQGSVRDVADFNSISGVSSLTGHRKYDSFGKITSETSDLGGFLYGFAGYQWDADSGLYYVRMRWYDAANGRWISEDPLGFAAGDSNLLRYLRNEPTRHSDPSGLADPTPIKGPRWENVGTEWIFRDYEITNGRYTNVVRLPTISLLRDGRVLHEDGQNIERAMHREEFWDWYQENRSSLVGKSERFVHNAIRDVFVAAARINRSARSTLIGRERRPTTAGDLPTHFHSSMHEAFKDVLPAMRVGFAKAAEALAVYGISIAGAKVIAGGMVKITVWTKNGLQKVYRISANKLRGKADDVARNLKKEIGCFVAGTPIAIARPQRAAALASTAVLGLAISAAGASLLSQTTPARRRHSRFGEKARQSGCGHSSGLFPVGSGGTSFEEPAGFGNASTGQAVLNEDSTPDITRPLGTKSRLVRPLSIALVFAVLVFGFGGWGEKSGPTKPIEEIRVGDVVKVDDARGDDDGAFGLRVEAATWRHIELRTLGDHAVHIELLRPSPWISTQRAEVGATIRISLPEMGIEGDAQVLAIRQCPEIGPIPKGHQVVTGTFRHEATNVINVSVEGLKSPIGTTTNHPFWSEDRQEYVPAGQLRIGERLRTLQGLAKVTSIRLRDGPEVVYNFEVLFSHNYHVARNGVLVHNACGKTADQLRVEKHRKRRAARRERQSRLRNGQNQSGSGFRDHASANKGPGGQKPKGPGGRNRERNIGIDEEHSRVSKGTGGGQGGH